MFAYTAGRAFDKAKPTMVFVHGAGLDHSWFGLQSRYFAYHGWNVLAFDLPGHGRSAGSPISSVQGMAECICTEVAAQKFSVVGHSMGSLVALQCAASAPSRVDRIALIGVAYPMKVGQPFLDAAKADSYDAFDMETIWGHAAQVPLGSNPSPGMWMYGDTQARLERLGPGVLYNDLKACNDYVLEGEIACPALFVLGKRDVMTPPRSAKSIQEKIPNAKTVLVEFSGHSLMAEAPDATLDALIDFFRT
ncbi:MAG TPA: alpha/beta hydrolase [Burkholderiales bacterium]|nr:alpha/beta hydrolase [Burkholderiales bacterium]